MSERMLWTLIPIWVGTGLTFFNNFLLILAMGNLDSQFSNFMASDAEIVIMGCIWGLCISWSLWNFVVRSIRNPPTHR